MPKIGFVEASNECKLDITAFCLNMIQDENGKYYNENEKEVYITIKKMPYSLKKKMSIMTMNSMGGKTGKQFLKQIKSTGKNIEDMDKLSDKEAFDLFCEIDMDIDEQEKISNYGFEIEKTILVNCIDPLKHNFTDNEGKQIQINNYDFWENIGNEKLIKFIITNIKNFSEGFFFKKEILKKSTIPSGQLFSE